MGTTFRIEGERSDEWAVDLNMANAPTLAGLLQIQLSGPDGRVGSLEPCQIVPIMARIEQLLQSDLSQYVRPYSDTHDPTITKLKKQVGAEPPKGLRVISPGTNVEYLERRLADFYSLFQRALDLNRRVVWS